VASGVAIRRSGHRSPERTRRLVLSTLLAAAIISLLLTLSGPALARVETIETRPGAVISFLAQAPEGASALVLLFEGGPGKLQPGSKGFAHKAYPIFLRHGIGAALIDAPADRDGFKAGLDPAFRESSAHMADIDAVIGALKQRYGLPVWILGTSNGTRSAAAYAMRHSAAIAGVVLVSSSTAPPFGEPLHSLPQMGAISVPLLAIAHVGDSCVGSPPAGAAEIVKAATGSPVAVAMLFAGGTDTGLAPCGVETHHSFHENEAEVVAAIVAFIARHTPVPGRAQVVTEPK